jgi:hypothetical protein
MVPIMEHAEGCHENAMCEPKDGAYKCKCKTGYRGDGINKCKKHNTSKGGHLTP